MIVHVEPVCIHLNLNLDQRVQQSKQNNNILPVKFGQFAKRLIENNKSVGLQVANIPHPAP